MATANCVLLERNNTLQATDWTCLCLPSRYSLITAQFVKSLLDFTGKMQVYMHT